MEFYKVLLVDDEEEVTDVIERTIDWHSAGFEVVGTAANGEKALDLVEKRQPDVVITDIRMPFMDGLELSRRLNNEFPNIHIIIMTGYDEFEYAKEAVHLEIEEYMLKPINAKELMETLTHLKETLDKERDEKLNVKKLESYFQESLPMLRTNYLVSLIEGRGNAAEVESYLQAYQIPFTGPEFCCVIFHTSTHHVPNEMNPMLLQMSVAREAENRLKENWKLETFSYLGNAVMIFELDSKEKMLQLTDDCDKFCRWAERLMGAVVTAGIGSVTEHLESLNLSYEGAREAVSYRVLYGTGRAIAIAEISPKEQESAFQAENTGRNDLFKAIHLGNREAIEKAALAVIQETRKTAKTVNQYKLSMMELVSAFYRFCSNNYIDFNDYLGAVTKPYDMVAELEEDALLTWLIEVSVSISDSIKDIRTSSSRRLITDAKNIVMERYSDPNLSLDMVCSMLGVSNSYFSSIFKKETGKAFITYLTDYRMENAVRLMLETEAKNYEIAEQVGYPDANYFSYVFKKSMGMSPSKYRTEHRKSE